MLRPDEAMSLLDRMSKTVGTPAMVKIDREMTPILAELNTVNPKNNEHPAAKQLFNWLVDPQRTGEEFHYVIGPLKRHVSSIMEKHFLQYMDNYNSLGKIAAEALAVKCPILEGYWEHAAWLLVMEEEYIMSEEYGTPSDCLSTWVIHVIGDPDLCPNPHLRFELIILLDIDNINDNDRTQAYESVLTACSSVDINYLQTLSKGCKFHQMDFTHITWALEILSQYKYDGYLLKFDEKLAEKLLSMKRSMVSALVHDAAYHTAVNPNRHIQPIALYGLSALLKTTAEYAEINHKKWVSMTLNIIWDFSNILMNERSWFDLILRIEEINDMLFIIVSSFSKSCQTPQLVDMTAFCVMAVIDLTFSAYMGSPELEYLKPPFKSSLRNIDRLLKKLFDKNGILHLENSPVGLEMTLKYKDRLSFLRSYQIYDYFNTFSSIKAVFFD